MKTQKLLLIACGVLVRFALMSTQALASRLETRWMPLHATVSVGADGRVTSVVLLEDKLSAAVKSTVVDTLKSWQFVPVLVDGVAAPALTYVNLEACAIPSGDGYDLAVHYVDNGPQLSEAASLEFSPSVAEYSNKHQSIRIKLRAAADGRAQLQDVVMVDVAPTVQREVRTTIKEWVWSMRFKPEEIGGHPVATDIEWPMDLIRHPIGERSPNVDLANDAACKAARSANVEPRSINSPVKLRDDLKAPEAKTPTQ